MTVFPHAQPPEYRPKRPASAQRGRGRIRVSGVLTEDKQDLREFHMERRACAIHQVSYIVSTEPDHDKSCPVCLLEARVKELQEQLTRTANELQLSMQNGERLGVQVNELEAMRKALTVISKEDLTFIKSVCYRFQNDDTGCQLIACQDADDRWQFLVRVKKAGAGRIGEEHLCNSFGGIALASAFEQSSKVSGNMKAMQMLVRAVSQHLATLEDS